MRHMPGTNADKHRYCLKMAEHYRDRYYQGRAESIEGLARREADIADQRWSRSALAKELISNEQMYSRWAVHYGMAALVDKLCGERGGT